MQNMDSSTSGLNYFWKDACIYVSHPAGFDSLPEYDHHHAGLYFCAMFLIFPLMFSTIIASESFAGEYERKNG